MLTSTLIFAIIKKFAGTHMNIITVEFGLFPNNEVGCRITCRGHKYATHQNFDNGVELGKNQFDISQLPIIERCNVHAVLIMASKFGLISYGASVLRSLFQALYHQFDTQNLPDTDKTAYHIGYAKGYWAGLARTPKENTHIVH